MHTWWYSDILVTYVTIESFCPLYLSCWQHCVLILPSPSQLLFSVYCLYVLCVCLFAYLIFISYITCRHLATALEETMMPIECGHTTTSTEDMSTLKKCTPKVAPFLYLWAHTSVKCNAFDFASEGIHPQRMCTQPFHEQVVCKQHKSMDTKVLRCKNLDTLSC